MKKYKVEMFSAGLDAEMNVADYAEAEVIYCRMRESEVYDSGHIVDNETGEVYAFFRPKTVVEEWWADTTPTPHMESNPWKIPLEL